MLSQIEADIFVHLSQTVGYNEKNAKRKETVPHLFCETVLNLFVTPAAWGRLSLIQPLSLLRRQLPYRGEPLAKRAGFTKCQGLSSIGATTTTAASGGNRESLLGPQPARRKQSAADAGCRNPGSGSALALTERLLPLRKNNFHRKEAVLALCGQGTFILLNDAVGHFDGVMGGSGVCRLDRKSVV